MHAEGGTVGDLAVRWICGCLGIFRQQFVKGPKGKNI